WDDERVVREMRDLNVAHLSEPERVAPFATFLRALDALIARNDLPRPARLLDIGCGTGHYSELIARHAPDRFVYTGCDASPQMIELAREQWPGRTFVVEDVFDDTLDLDSYDVLLASALLDVTREFEHALDRLLGSAATHVIVHRQQMTAGASRLEVGPGSEGHGACRTYPSVHVRATAAGGDWR